MVRRIDSNKAGRLFPATVLGIVIGLAAILAVGVWYLDPVPEKPVKVVNVTKITVKTVTGSVVHDQIYEVMILDETVDPALVRHAILLTPNVFGFVMVPEDTDWYYIDENGMPWPDEDFLVLFIDRENYPYMINNNLAGYTSSPSGRVVIGIGDNWTAMYIAEVLTHECTHNVEITKRLDFGYLEENRREFSNWLWLNGYGTYPDGFTGWNGVYSVHVIDEYLTVTVQ